MKALIFISSLLIFLAACNPQNDNPLTEQQKEQIKMEAKAVVDSVVMKFEELDVKGALSHYWNSPEFIAIDGTGLLGDYESNEKGATGFVDMASSIKITPISERYRVSSKDFVICAWIGREELVLKSGGNLIFDPMAETLLLQKIEGKWKIIYDHQSATLLPPPPEE